MKSETVTVTAGLISEYSVGFRVLKDGKPVSGATVSLCDKAVVPHLHTKSADEGGVATFDIAELFPEYPMPPEDLVKVPWLFFAYIDGSEYAVWKDDAKFEAGKIYDFSLKKYTSKPEFFIKLELEDVIGAELFSNFIAGVESEALKWSGLVVTGVEGSGTKTVTVRFTLPMHSSPIVIEWAAVWFILKVLAVALAVILVLSVSKWTFGEWAPAVGLGLLVVVGLAIASLPKRKEEEKYG
jgi:hypothetical protein